MKGGDSVKALYVLMAMVLGVLGAGSAEAAWTVDLTALTTDVNTIGATLLALTVVIFGFRVVRKMVGR